MAFVPEFVQINLDYLKPNLPKLGDELRLTRMNTRIFADYSSPRHDFSGNITYLFENMYPADRWVYVQMLIEAEEKRFSEQKR